jgi:hypothetical protein
MGRRGKKKNKHPLTDTSTSSSGTESSQGNTTSDGSTSSASSNKKTGYAPSTDSSATGYVTSGARLPVEVLGTRWPPDVMEAAANQLQGKMMMPMPELLKTKGTQSSDDALSDVDSPPAEEEAAKTPDVVVLEEAAHKQVVGDQDPATVMINQTLDVEDVDMNPTAASATNVNVNPTKDTTKQVPQPEIRQARAIPRASETEATPAEVQEVRQELRRRMTAARNRSKQQGKQQSQPRGARKQPLPGRVFTPEMPTLPDTKVHTKYYDLRFYLDKCQDPRGHLFERIEEVMMALFDRDPTITLNPYLEENRMEEITTLNHENWHEMREKDSLVELQCYFHKAIEYYRRGGYQTVRILMTREKTLDWLMGELTLQQRLWAITLDGEDASVSYFWRTSLLKLLRQKL